MTDHIPGPYCVDRDGDPSCLHFAELRSLNVARVPFFKHSLQDWNALEWAGAMAGEAGEAANVAKKIRRLADGSTINSTDLDGLRHQLADEIADVVIYADLLAAREGIDLGEAVCRKFDEVSRRVGFTVMLCGAGGQDMTDDLIRRLLAVDTASADGASLACNWYRNPDGREAAAEITSLREQVRVLREAAQWVMDACNEAGNDAQVHLIIAAERCEDAIDAAKAMEDRP